MYALKSFSRRCKSERLLKMCDTEDTLHHDAVLLFPTRWSPEFLRRCKILISFNQMLIQWSLSQVSAKININIWIVFYINYLVKHILIIIYLWLNMWKKYFKINVCLQFDINLPVSYFKFKKQYFTGRSVYLKLLKIWSNSFTSSNLNSSSYLFGEKSHQFTHNYE